MNSLLLFGGGAAAVAYLLLRSQEAAAARAASAPTSPPPSTTHPAPGASPATPSGPPPPPSSPQITAPAPPSLGEVAPTPPATTVALAGRWGWPVPRYEGRAPVISDGFGSPRPSLAGGKHQGVDLMFARIASDPFPGGPNGTKGFVMPDAWMAVAASDGVLWSAGYTPRGFAVVVDHGRVATFYQHLDALLVPETRPPAKGKPGDARIAIKAGQPLGVIGADPQDPSRLKHLHFELWLGAPGNAIDPQPLMKAWQVFTPQDIAPFFPSLRRNAAKRPARRPELVAVRAHERRWPGSSLHPPR